MKIPRDWTFKKFSIAKGFDRHVREQLPWYDLATGIVRHIVRHYLNRGGLVYDIGASTGNIGKSISDILKNREASFIAIDNSEEMLKLYSGPGKIELWNAEEYEYKNFDIAICFLSLLFLSQEKKVLKNIVSILTCEMYAREHSQSNKRNNDAAKEKDSGENAGKVLLQG